MRNAQFEIIDSENGFGKCLLLKGEWQESYASAIRNEGISVLRLSESMGWKSDNVEFLRDLKNSGLRGVEIYSWNVKDISPLEHLLGLESIGLQCEFSKSPDFSAFNKLSHLQIMWRPKAVSVFACKGLQLLNVINFPEQDLTKLQDMDSLHTLKLTSRKLSSLSGIESLKSLKELDLADCSKLTTVSGVESCELLESLAIDGCKKVSECPPVKNLVNLQSLSFNDGGKIKSLAPLSESKSLKTVSFYGTTDIEDGDLDVLTRIESLKSVKFGDRKHYSLKRSDIEKRLNGPTSRLFKLFK